MNYKVSFEADIAFSKGRITREIGDCNLSSELSINEMRWDDDLRRFIGMHVNRKYKTGSVINVVIKDIQTNYGQ